jgi:hypothetical protein
MSKPELTIDEAINAFAHRDEYKFLLEMLRVERENALTSMGRAVDPFSVGKWAGHIDGLTFSLDLLTPKE